MYSLKECHPNIAIVNQAVAELSDRKVKPVTEFYKFRAYEIRRLIAAGEYRHAVNVLADSCHTGTYAAACVWCVAGAMLERGSLEGFYAFKKAIIAYMEERRIVTKYKVGEENAITFMKGQTTDANAAAVELRDLAAMNMAQWGRNTLNNHFPFINPNNLQGYHKF